LSNFGSDGPAGRGRRPVSAIAEAHFIIIPISYEQEQQAAGCGHGSGKFTVERSVLASCR